MTRKTIIILTVVSVIAAAAAGAWMYVTGLPEYALARMAQEVREDGISSLEPHLGTSLRDIFHTVISLADSPLVRLITGSNEIVRFVSAMERTGDWSWSLKKVERMDGSARVTIALEGLDISGNIGFMMVRTGSGWILDNIALPLVGNIV